MALTSITILQPNPARPIAQESTNTTTTELVSASNLATELLESAQDAQKMAIMTQQPNPVNATKATSSRMDGAEDTSPALPIPIS